MFNPSLRHLGIYAYDVDKMVPFYERWFNMIVADIGIGSTGDKVAFMTGDPTEHHQLAIATGRQANTPGFNQVSFLLDTLEELVELTRAFAREGVEILQQKNHGNSWSVYVADPEGNRLEIYAYSPWHVSQPVWWPMDMLESSAEEIRADTESRVNDTPGTISREEWIAGMQRRIDARKAENNARS